MAPPKGAVGAVVDAKLKALRQLMSRQIILEDTVANLEERLAEEKGKLLDLQTRVIPDFMASVDLKKIESNTGAVLSLRAYVSAKDTEEGHVWLEEQGCGDVIRYDISIHYTKGESDEAKKALAAIAELEDVRAPDTKLWVHHSTLGATLRELVKNGVKVPLDLFGENAFVGQKSYIKRPKKEMP